MWLAGRCKATGIVVLIVGALVWTYGAVGSSSVELLAENRERLSVASSLLSSKTHNENRRAQVVPRRVLPQQLISRNISRPSLSPLLFTEEACFAKVLNCSTKVLLLHALRYSATGDNASNWVVKLRSETNQLVRFSVSPRASSNLERTSAGVCRHPVHVAHLLSAHYHTNLMHTLFRVASVQRAVEAVKEFLLRHCGSVRPHVSALVVPRYVQGHSLGFYTDLLPLLNVTTRIWPQQGEELCVRETSRTPSIVDCRSNVLFQFDHIPFYGSRDASAAEAFAILRDGMVHRWLLRDSQNESMFSVRIVNRQKSRRMRNADVMAAGIREALSNWTAAHSVAVNVSVGVVFLENLTPQEQAQIFFTSDAIVAVHGAALAWLLAAKRGAYVVELFPPGWSFLRRDASMFQPLSAVAEVADHILYPLKDHREHVDPFSRNFSLSKRDIKKIVDWSVYCAQRRMQQ